MEGCRIYSTLYPCNECAKKIAQKEITEVIYLSEKHNEEEFHIASVKIFEAAGIRIRQLKMLPLREIVNKFSDFLDF
jgi:dCMP deaminase